MPPWLGEPSQEGAGASVVAAGARAEGAEGGEGAAVAATEARAVAPATTTYGATDIRQRPARVQEEIARTNAANREAERARRALKSKREDEERQERRRALTLQRRAEPPGGSAQGRTQHQVPAQA